MQNLRSQPNILFIRIYLADVGDKEYQQDKLLLSLIFLLVHESTVLERNLIRFCMMRHRHPDASCSLRKA